MQDRYIVNSTIRNAHDEGVHVHEHPTRYEHRDDADAVAEYIYDLGNEDNGGIVAAVRVFDSQQDTAYQCVTRISSDGFYSYDPDAVEELTIDQLKTNLQKIRELAHSALATPSAWDKQAYLHDIVAIAD